MEQIIHSRQAILDPEFLLEDTPDVLGPQCADAIGLGGTSQETVLEGSVLGHGQLAGAARLSFGGDCVQPMIAIGVHPQLHKSSATRQSLCDLGRTAALEGQDDSSIAVSLFGVALLAASLTQLFEIVGVMSLDLHETVPPFLREYATCRPRPIPYFDRRARILPNPYYLMAYCVDSTPGHSVESDLRLAR